MEPRQHQHREGQHRDGQQRVAPEDALTHFLDNVKVGDHSVQLLVSTREHQFDARNIEAGYNAWQVVGTFDDSSIQELTKMVSSRQVVPSTPAGPAKFASSYGSGHVLGATTNTASSSRVDRPSKSV